MAKIFKPSAKKQLSGKILPLKVERLDLNGEGVAMHQGKPVFIASVLPKEQVKVKIIEQRNKYARAHLLEVSQESAYRASPDCAHYKTCGGCDLQHYVYEEHLSFKQQKVAELFSRNDIQQVLPWCDPIVSQPWHYRRKARIGVQYNKKHQPIIGFRKKQTNELTEIKKCSVLVEPLTGIFVLLRALLTKLTLSKSVGHIEVISTEQVTLVVRQLKKINDSDKKLWLEYAAKNHWQVLLDYGEQCEAITPVVPLSYRLNADIDIHFDVKDFIQVNHFVNVEMVTQALIWLNVSDSDSVLDLFCGLGNFSLALANKVNHVVGVEGVQSMVDKACKNAQHNNLTNCQFYQADLNDNWLDQPWAQQKYDSVLLDPARAGALQATEQIIALNIPKVLYVSCDPSTLARDAKLFLLAGYRIEKIMIMDMFAQTKHVETMVLFQS